MAVSYQICGGMRDCGKGGFVAIKQCLLVCCCNINYESIVEAIQYLLLRVASGTQQKKTKNKTVNILNIKKDEGKKKGQNKYWLEISEEVEEGTRRGGDKAQIIRCRITVLRAEQSQPTSSTHLSCYVL